MYVCMYLYIYTYLTPVEAGLHGSFIPNLNFSGCYGPSWSNEARLWNHADDAAGQELWAKMLQGAPRVPLPLQFGKGQVGLKN